MKKYFIRAQEREGSCYFEFYRGTWNRKRGIFWHKDSICISDCDFQMTGLQTLIAEIIPRFDEYGVTAVSYSDWEKIKARAAAEGGALADVVNEAGEWAAQNFYRHKVFTILGI